MRARDGQEELAEQFAQWRQYVQGRRELQPSDAEELEDHLRGSVDALVAAGLSADEAFLVAVKRLGSLDELSREFAREHSERLWKQLVLTGGTGGTGGPATEARARRDLWVMVACAAGAAVSVKVPELFGMRLAEDGGFYGPNLGLFALPWLAAFLAWRRQVRGRLIGILVALFALGAVAANVYPLADTSQSVVITFPRCSAMSDPVLQKVPPEAAGWQRVKADQRPSTGHGDTGAGRPGRGSGGGGGGAVAGAVSAAAGGP